MRKALAFVSFLSFVVFARMAGGVELTPFVGFNSGGIDFATGLVCVQPPCGSFAESEPGLLYGAAVDVPLRDDLAFEVLLSRQGSELAFKDSRSGPPTGLPKADFDLTHLHVGLLRSWKLSSLQPFGVLGVGLTRLESESSPFLVARVDDDRPSASLGGGFKVPVGESLAVRLEGRGYWIDAPESLGGDAVQVEASTGLSFRW